MFVSSGFMWAGFTIQAKRWGIDPVAAASVVSVLSILVCAPGHLAEAGFSHLAALPVRVLVLPVIVLGLLSGVVGVIAFARAVQLLGAGAPPWSAGTPCRDPAAWHGLDFIAAATRGIETPLGRSPARRLTSTADHGSNTSLGFNRGTTKSKKARSF